MFHFIVTLDDVFTLVLIAIIVIIAIIYLFYVAFAKISNFFKKNKGAK